MIVLTFLPRFAPLVEAGTKTCTIRGVRKRPIRVGDDLSLRQWTGRPYGSPQRVLREARCTRISAIELLAERLIVVDGRVLTFGDAGDFALADGFTGLGDFWQHFDAARGLPFAGVLIGWSA